MKSLFSSLLIGKALMMVLVIFTSGSESHSLHTPFQSNQSNNIQSNHYKQPVQDSSLPLCSSPFSSVCAHLQVNSYGITVQPSCNCPIHKSLIGSTSSSCPVTWDSSDGHSVTQGSDQFKFCGPAPALETCQTGAMAYSKTIVFKKPLDEEDEEEEEIILTRDDRIHCICPEGSGIVPVDQKESEPTPETEALEIQFTCVPLPVCSGAETCKSITDNLKGEIFVERKCRCPLGLRCPTKTNKGVQTQSFGRGIVQSIRCQR